MFSVKKPVGFNCGLNFPLMLVLSFIYKMPVFTLLVPALKMYVLTFSPLKETVRDLVCESAPPASSPTTGMKEVALDWLLYIVYDHCSSPSIKERLSGSPNDANTSCFVVLPLKILVFTLSCVSFFNDCLPTEEQPAKARKTNPTMMIFFIQHFPFLFLNFSALLTQ